jgi:hypothetical protein
MPLVEHKIDVTGALLTLSTSATNLATATREAFAASLQPVITDSAPY